MMTQKWDKQNYFIRNVGWGLTAGILLLVSIVPTGLGRWLFPIASLPILALGWGVTAYLMKKYPNVMIRIIRTDFREIEEFERNFRILLNQHGIRYQRTIEPDIFTYEFSGHGLTMTLEPYFMHNLQVDNAANDQPATSVVLQKVTEKNRPFTEKLTTLIDQMVIEHTSSW